jgi:alkaline phosphatase
MRTVRRGLPGNQDPDLIISGSHVATIEIRQHDQFGRYCSGKNDRADAGPAVTSARPVSRSGSHPIWKAIVSSLRLTEIEDRPIARNVILLIGDGMGQAHRFAAQLLAAGRGGRLAMDRLPYVGEMGTTTVDPTSFVTDSAAAATAIATGVKTLNGSVSIDLKGQERTTILELAKASGRSVGLVSTCQITDATPAAFAAHVPHRADQSEVARQYIERTGVDVILGGGAAHWYPDGAPLPEPLTVGSPCSGVGSDGNLVAMACQLGYEFVTDAAALGASLDRRRREPAGPLLGLFAAQEFFVQTAEGFGAVYDPPVALADLTSAAIEILAQNPRGFFLMVEESAIDRMAHRNNAPLMLKGVLELDRAVQVALAFAEHAPETLIVVTADHECGGLAVAGSEDQPYPYEPGGGLLDTMLAGEDGPFPVADAGYGFVVGWATTGHTATPVPITSTGPGAERLTGEIENTDLFPVMAEAMDLSSILAGSRPT